MSYDSESLSLDGLGTVALSDVTELAVVNPGNPLGNATVLALLAYLSSKAISVASATVISSLISGDTVLGLRSGSLIAIPTGFLGSGGGTTPSPATTFRNALSASTVVSGSAITHTVSPDGGLTWPSGVTVTPKVSGVAGSFSPTSASPTGTTSASFQYTPSSAGTASLDATATGMTSDGAQNLTVTSSASPATSYTISTPSSGTAGTPQTVTVQANGSLSSAVTVTLSDGSDGAFGGTVTLAAGSAPSGSTTYTPGSAGTKSLAATNTGGLTNPGAISVTVAAAGSSYPSPIFASSPTPAYVSGANAIFGSGASLSAGKASLALNLVPNPSIGGGPADQAIGTLLCMVKVPTGQFNGAGQFLSMTSTSSDGTKTTLMGWSVNYQGNASMYLDGTHDTSFALTDGKVHQLEMLFLCNYGGNYLDLYGDGASIGNTSGGNTYLRSGQGNAALNIDMSQMPAGSLLDVVWLSNNHTQHALLTTEPSRDTNTNALILFDAQSGAGS